MKIGSDDNFYDILYVEDLDSVSLSAEYFSELKQRDPDDIVRLLYNIVEENTDLISDDSHSSMSGWYLKLKIASILGPEILSKLSESKNLDYGLHMHILREGFYRDIEVFDRIVLDKGYQNEVRSFCASLCQIETLRKLKKDRCKEIREVVFSRLGPKECLDDMSKDKVCQIRISAAKLTPALSKDMNIFLKDKSRRVLNEIIMKLELTKVLFLFGNQKVMKDQVASKRIKERLNRNV